MNRSQVIVSKVKLQDMVFGGGSPLVLIAGPCVIESRTMVMRTAERLTDITARLKVPFVFKVSYDKANRTSLTSFRGLGMKEGLKILAEVKETFGVTVTSDVHTVEEVDHVKSVVDILQIPAFLCRQTDLLVKAARSGKVVNVKKGQFLAPWDMAAVVQKIRKSGNRRILLTERGTSFGYNCLVSDFRSLAQMRNLKCPVVFDATHSVQQPGGLGKVSGGQREFVPLLARCGVAAGCDAVFMEVHPNPDKARSDGPNMLSLDQVEDLLVELMAIDTVVKRLS